jgi:hypothetical protein
MKRLLAAWLVSAFILILQFKLQERHAHKIVAVQAEIPNFTVDGVSWHVWHEQTVTRPNPADGSTAYLYGYTTCETHVVEVRRELPPCYEREVVMHELMHAAMCDWRQLGVSFEKTQFNGHEAIERLAPHVVRIISDNPQLAAYFAAAPDCYELKPH